MNDTPVTPEPQGPVGPDPMRHASERGMIESILRYIPGFHGYLEKEYRRKSDQLLRDWLADHLQRSKKGLEQYSLALVDMAAIDELPQCERMRNRLDRVISRVRGGVGGLSSFFEFVNINAEVLDTVYENDLETTTLVDALARAIEELRTTDATPSEVIPGLLKMIEDVDDCVNRRTDILKGVGDA